MRWLRALAAGMCALVLLLTMAACADDGTVKDVKWHEDSLGNSTCDLVIQPDDLDTARYTVTNRRKQQCDQCSVNARWPSCAKSREGSNGDRPDPPQHTIPWNPGPDGDRPVKNQGDTCTSEGAPAQTSGGTPMRCRDGKWKLS